MLFHDANTCIGRPANAGLTDGASAGELLAAMDRAGIAKALVWHVAQRDSDPLRGNALLAEAIADHLDRLAGCWSILPTQTGEIGDVDEWFRAAAAAGVRAMRAWPAEGRYLLRGEVVGPVVERMIAARWPLVLAPNQPADWRDIHDLMGDFPELTVILTDVGCWGADRYFRPLIERYPNVYLEIADYFLDGGIEACVGDYGPRRLLFGSGFPTRYPGAMMLALRAARIAEADKAAVAGANLQRLLSEVKA